MIALDPNNDRVSLRADANGRLQVALSAQTGAPALATVGDIGLERVSNTQLRISMRGSDGVTRSVVLTLA